MTEMNEVKIAKFDRFAYKAGYKYDGKQKRLKVSINCPGCPFGGCEMDKETYMNWNRLCAYQK